MPYSFPSKQIKAAAKPFDPLDAWIHGWRKVLFVVWKIVVRDGTKRVKTAIVTAKMGINNL